MLRKLFDTLLAKNANNNPPSVLSETAYAGFTIRVAPRKDDNGWRVAGEILRDDRNDEPSQSVTFVRADVFGSREVAGEMTLMKAQRLIDEQGDQLFTHQS